VDIADKVLLTKSCTIDWDMKKRSKTMKKDDE